MTLQDSLKTLIEAADPDGPFFLGQTVSFVDVQLIPWILRLRRVLKPYRGWPDPEPGTRWAKWVDAAERHENVRATTSDDQLYLDSYERYAGMPISPVCLACSLEIDLLWQMIDCRRLTYT